MADDLTTQSATLATIPASSVIATDDVAGKHYQKMKLFDGTADSATAIAVAGGAEANALRVTIASDSTGVVSVDDNGASLTVDGTVDTELTTADLDTGAGTDTRAVVGIVGSKSGGGQLIPGDATAGLKVDLGADNDVTVTGSVTANAGTNLNTASLALEGGGNLAAAAASLSVLDDWDETDRAKVNIIAGQVGVEGGAGASSALTQRVAIATDANTIQGSVTVASGSITADTELTTADLDTGAGSDVRAVVGLVGSKSGGGQLLPGDATAGLKVDLGADNDVTVTGSVTVTSGAITADTELMAAAALADAAAANPTTPSVGAVGLLMNATTLDRQRAVIAALDSTGIGIAAAGIVGQFDDTSTAAVTENQFAPVRISTRRALLVEGVASGTAQPVSGSVSLLATALTIGGVDETGASAVDALAVGGGTPHDSIDSGNPLLNGARAIAHGTNPTAVAAADRTVLFANRAGVPFVIGGHPNVVTIKHTTITTAVTDAAIVTIAGGLKIVVTRVTVTLDNASTVFPTLLIGFGTANTPTTTGVLVAHGGVPAGGGVNVGDGSGILGVGADGEDLRVTTTGNATGNGLQIVVSYYTIES